MTTTLRGADLVVRALRNAGTRYVFTLSGNHIMSVFDASIGSGLELVHVRHEGATVHMADAWARLTGDVGIALVTGGPGHANAVGALYTALAADSPIVLLSGHAPVDELGLGAFQEMRQADIAAPLVKASWTAQTADGLANDVAEAIRIAKSGRPGPVHVSLPSDLLEATVSADTTTPDCRAFAPIPHSLAATDATRLATLIRDAARPMLVGGPVLDTAPHRALLAAAASALDAPAVVMASPRGINDPSLGAFAAMLSEADLVVLIGKPLDFTLKFGRAPFIAPDARIAIVEPDVELAARARKAFADRLVFAASADAAPTLTALQSASPPGQPRTGGWTAKVASRVAYRPPAWAAAKSSGHGTLHPVEMCRTVAEALAAYPDAILVADGGEIGQWAQAAIPTARRVINGVAGSIGAALPFALAARLADRTAPIVAVMGDGTFGFHMAELDTAVRYGLPVVLVIGNDACWNAEHQIQLKTYGADRTIGCDLLPSAYDAVATALGGTGARITDRTSLAAALRAAFSDPRPTCLNVMIESVPAPVVKHP